MNDTINRYLAILCYPFSSIDFFLEDYFEKIILAEQKSVQKKEEEKLKESLINHIQNNYYVYSYDEVYMYLEKCYLFEMRLRKYKKASSLYLDSFQKMMHSMISQRDGEIVFKYWENSQDKNFLGGFGDTNKIFLFHSMNMHIPLDFIVMLYLVQNPRNDIKSLDYYYGQIEVADQQLDVVMKSGVAENHLHKGVSLSFFEIWEDFMSPIDSFSVRAFEELDIRLSDGNITEEEALLFLLTAAIVRVWIALELQGYSWEDGEINTAGTKGEWVTKERTLGQMVSYFEKGEALDRFYKDCWGSSDKSAARHEIIIYFQKLWDTLLQILPEQTEGQTIMQKIFNVPEEIHTSDENILLFYAMRYLKEQEERTFSKKDEKLVRCILQYLRIRNYVFGRTVQKKTVRGLDYFQSEYYSRDSKMNRISGKISCARNARESKKVFWKRAMRKQFQNRDLKKIEFRASIDNNEAAFRKNVKAFLEAYRDVIREDYCEEVQGKFIVRRSFPRVGMVFHLLKQRDEYIPRKCFLDGLDDREKMQFGVLQEKYDIQIDNMRRLREEIPGMDRYIVGIDAASLENATPVWVFSRAYEKARDGFIEKIGYNQSGTHSLRFTFHAGEDFRHILSGLRRMDEAVTFLKFHAGDRIGHGTALGISPQQWHRCNPFVVMPGIEALENYIWAYYLLSQNTVNFQSTLMAYLERRINELARGIYGKSAGITLQILMEGYLKTFEYPSVEYYEKCKKAEDIGFCEAVRKGKSDEIVWNGEKIALARHCKKFLTEMERPIHYEVTEQDIKITEILQKVLRKKLSRNGIVVEINPSSNIAIGEVDKIVDNQIYQLNRPGGEDNVMVCINSDDPTVFHTNVSNEFSYIYYGMLYNGISREKALEWIDKVRECGMKSSFVQDEGTDQQVYDWLDEMIEHL